jgi:hypothetical protein
MSSEATPALRFPTPCTTCGGVLYQYVNFCPYCGVSRPLDDNRRRRPQARLRAVNPETRRAPEVADEPKEWPSPTVVWRVGPGSTGNLLSPPSLSQTVGRWIGTRGVILLASLFVLGYAGYVWLGHGRAQDSDSEEISTGVTSSSASVPRFMPEARDGASATVVAGGGPAANAITQQVGSRAPNGAKQHRLVSDALGDAYSSLARNDLRQAKAAVTDALSIAPGNPDALRMQNDVTDRENQRDVALGVANTCASEKMWRCVFERSSQALAIDASNADAQALLQRAILSTGWKPLVSTVVAPAPRKPAPLVTSSVLPTLPPLPPGVPANSVTTPPANKPAPAAYTAPVRDGGDGQTRGMRKSEWNNLSPAVSLGTK